MLQARTRLQTTTIPTERRIILAARGFEKVVENSRGRSRAKPVESSIRASLVGDRSPHRVQKLALSVPESDLSHGHEQERRIVLLQENAMLGRHFTDDPFAIHPSAL